ncbi:probable calcium-binding protein CML15 [Cucurbita maxima]|uniref:Probable calcium-binding protein CML15 n=1 Tax=Cucurbita maxima TaxID=3661 RepID=A0A6J1KQ84_CUCMA|nr:probable calcium-binding protein CML15 [Cucurbita maxima]
MESLQEILQRPLSEKEADCVLKLRDTNKDGVLEKKELMNDLRPSKLQLTREQIKEIFLEHDIDGDGCLSVSELSKAFNFMGSSLSFHKARHGMALADCDGDGLISEEELDKLVDYFEKTNKKCLKRVVPTRSV